MAKKNPYIKVKQMEVSSRSLFGRPSNMDKAIAKWTGQGWTLAQKGQIRNKERYHLIFIYQMSEEEIAAMKKRQRNGGIGCLAVIIIIAIISSINANQRNAEIAITKTFQGTAIAYANATAKKVAANETATATLWTPTPTPTPTDTATATNTATNTFTPTSTFTPSNTPTASNTPTRTNTPTITPTPSITKTPTNTATVTPVPTKRPTNLPEVQYYVTGSANARECERTNCAVVERLTTGTIVFVVGSVEGEDVFGSTEWKQVRYMGKMIYIHSSLVSEDFVPTSAPVQVQQVQQQPVQQQPEEQLMSTPVPNAPPSFVPNCSGEVYDCPDLTCNQMAIYWAACPGDPSGLDGNDNDGRYCESTCG